MTQPDYSESDWPAAAFFKSGSGCEIAYREFGDPQMPAIILVHCIGLDGRMWAGLIPALSNAHRLILPDLRGHGASAISDRPFEMADLGRDLVDLCDHLAISRATLIGCSIGANMAMWLAANEPERFRAVVLANGPAHLPLPAEIADAICNAALGGGMAALARDMVGRWVSDDFRERDGGAPFEKLVRRMGACPAEAFVPALRALLGSDRTADLSRIAVPALVIAGGLDTAFDGAAAGQMAAAIPGARAAVIESAAHLPAIEQPEEFAACVMAFLGRDI